jgi:hypothetical protein
VFFGDMRVSAVDVLQIVGVERKNPLPRPVDHVTDRARIHQAFSSHGLPEQGWVLLRFAL